jgi:hypothetical protein
MAVFEVEAEPSAQTLSRVLEGFARRDLMPEKVSCTLCGDSLLISIAQSGVDDAQLAIMAETMRASVLVKSVELKRPTVGETCGVAK